MTDTQQDSVSAKFMFSEYQKDWYNSALGNFIFKMANQVQFYVSSIKPTSDGMLHIRLSSAQDPKATFLGTFTPKAIYEILESPDLEQIQTICEQQRKSFINRRSQEKRTVPRRHTK
jgi:hypothetical protein